MTDKIKVENDYNPQYFERNQALDRVRNHIPTISSTTMRPNTLPMTEQRLHNPVLFTPSDYTNLVLSTPDFENLQSITTPDLINSLVMPTNIDVQASPGTALMDGIFPTRIEHPIIPTTNQYNSATCQIVSNIDNRQSETISAYNPNHLNSDAGSYNPSVSSYTMDNESSNSATSSSPSSVTQQSKRIKEELQHVPSATKKLSGEEGDFVRKEKKRERNRQAAQKCRTRKLTRIAELQKRVDELQGKNKGLSNIAECLKSDIINLERKLHEHHSQGCALMNGSML